MPSGRTHDAITLFLAAPAFGASYIATRQPWLAAIMTAAFVFGGLMFGPDLDTVSKQYARWWVFKGLWFPYRTFFKHRSRWSHGLIFGTLLRVIYFTGVITLGGVITPEWLSGIRVAGFAELTQTLGQAGDAFRTNVGLSVGIAFFAGVWLGAASHTFTDMAGTYIKTGKVDGFF